jgi:hypothetical protein
LRRASGLTGLRLGGGENRNCERKEKDRAHVPPGFQENE